jgi:NADPH:quinone reductase-like Zn-dependent oxidoreductase
MSTLVSRPGTTAPVLTDAAPPAPGPTDLLVDVVAAGVNPVDVFVAAGPGRAMLGLEGEVGLGWDLAGVVRAVGEGVTGFAVGDTIAGLLADPSAAIRAHATRTIVPAAAAALVPAGLDRLAAASIPLNATTAAQALDLFGPSEGRTLLVTGAAGAVGGYAVALARRAGWRVTGLARAGDRDFVLAAGAEAHVSDLDGVRTDAVLDAAGLQEAAIGAVRDGGRFVGVLPASPVAAERGVTVSTVLSHADGALLGDLLALHVEGVLTARVAGSVGLADAATAYEKVAGGGQRGRWLLLP